MKKCSKCKLNKLESCFHFKNKSILSYQSQCKDCQSLYQQNHYLRNKSKYKQKAKKNNVELRLRNKKYFNDYKSKTGCKFCPEKESVCLDFHHLDSEQKEKNVSKMINSVYSVKTILKEVSKCILVCSNCHRKIHAGIIIL